MNKFLKPIVASLVGGYLGLSGLLAFPALAQNPTCPTRPNGDSTNACASTAFVQGALATSTRVPLTGNQNYYVNGNSGSTAACGAAGLETCVAGSDSNNCTTAATACLTLQHVIDNITAKVDIANKTVTIYLAHNAGTSNYAATCSQGGWVGTSVILIRGDSAAPTATVVADPNLSYGLQVKDNCTLDIAFLSFVDSGSSNASGHIIVGGSGNAGHVDISNVTFNALAIGVHITTGYLGTLTATGSNTIAGGGNFSLAATDGGVIDFGAQTITVSGTPAFTTGFAFLKNGGSIEATASTFSGAATGTRCQINGPMNTGLALNPNKIFPGNVDCVANSYVGAIGLQSGSGGASTLAFGSSGQCLTSGGSSSILNTWANCAGAGVPQNNLNTQTTNYTIQTTDCGKTIQAGTGTTGQFTVTLPAVAGFAANCVLAVYNGDTGRGKILSGFPAPLTSSPSNILWPQDTINVGIVNGAWALLTQAARHKITASTTVFVNSGGSDSNDCLASGTSNACATIMGALNYINTWDGNEQAITISVADGTYTGAITQNGPFHGNPTVTLQGNLATPANAIISVTGSVAFLVKNGGVMSIGGFKITTTGTHAIQALAASFINVTGAMEYGSVTSGHLVANQASVITVSANYTISGGGANHYNAAAGSQINDTGLTITLTGTPAFSSAFARAQTAGNLSVFGNTYSGAATGTRYAVSLGGVIFTNQTSDTYFPGNAGGTVASGGRADGLGTPGVSSCGTSPGTANGNDFSGNVTEGTTATGCTITFKTASTMNSCTVTLSSGTAIGITTLGSTLVVTHASVSNNVLYWTCQN